MVNDLFVERCAMVISATIWGLGPEGTITRLLFGFLKNQREEETKQERDIKN